MPKKKTNATSNKEEESIILEYLTKTNRPYSATDIFNNLHATISKGNITKTLDKLIEDEVVVSKTYGKQVIYSVKQQTDNQPTPEEVEAIEKKTAELQEKYDALAQDNKKAEQVLSSIKHEPTTAEAKELVEKLKQQNQQLQEKLNNLKSGTILIPPEKRKRANEDYERNRNLWKKRRGMFRDIFRTITEHYPGNPNQLKEEIGIEEDPIPFEQDPLQQ
ncbi:Tat binding protein 1-interacting protein-domain-containing protein [Mycotypha africana]|uniref:Tat binding protein 1-interacting protein-domain-containing protein n=1 Tax=Mycotypha africana TaxID=64632 RepID=UPI002300521B|nr:Tat binding protein 1-interacting protein-domain-containing protein [Mycotypha africana]KAI8969084.1 Tat binding protein 1-interacting protein-domain-containing protein [Mycotypha africana]